MSVRMPLRRALPRATPVPAASSTAPAAPPVPPVPVVRAEKQVQDLSAIADQFISLFPQDIEMDYDGQLITCSKKNIIIELHMRGKVTSADRNRFLKTLTGRHGRIGVFVSYGDLIPFEIDFANCVLYTHISDFNERLVEMIINQPDIDETELKDIALENCKKHVKESMLDQFESTETGFVAYCQKVPKSKIEFEKAKGKWPVIMNSFKKKEEFINYILDCQDKEEVKHTPGMIPEGANEFPYECNTLDGFYEYIRETPVQKINKKTINQFFSAIDPEVSCINLTGDKFRTAIKELHDQLKEQEKATVAAAAKPARVPVPPRVPGRR